MIKNLIQLLVTTALIIFIGGCNSNTEDLDDFGPESTAEEINNALVEGMGTFDYNKMSKGDFIHRVSDQSFTTSNGKQTALVEESGYNVLEKVATATEITFTLVREVIDYTSDEVQKNSFESEFVVSLTNSTEQKLKAAQKLRTRNTRKVLRQFASALVDSSNQESAKSFEAKVTYHNLSTGLKTIDVPSRVQDRTNCGGVPSCKITVFVVKYDEVVHESESSAQRYRNEYYFSNDIPYSPFNGELNLFKNCFTGIGRVENSRLLLTQCRSVVDFRFGSESSPSNAESIDFQP